jgi:transposase
VKRSTSISLSAADEKLLREWIRKADHFRFLAERARIILLAAEGRSTLQIARALGLRMSRISKWRMRFATYGLVGMEDQERTGKPRSYDSAIDDRILRLVNQSPPDPHATWTGPLVAEALGNVSVDYVWRVLRAHGIHLRVRTRGDFEIQSPVAFKLIGLTGLYLSGRGSAFVISEADQRQCSPGCVVRSSIRVPDPKTAAGLWVRDFDSTQPTLLESLQWSAGLVETGLHDKVPVPVLDEFLADCRMRSPAGGIHAFITGSPLAPHSEEHRHFVPVFDVWKSQLGSWLSVFMRGGPSEVSEWLSRFLPAVDRFVAARAGRAVFEWHAWLIKSRSVRIGNAE